MTFVPHTSFAWRLWRRLVRTQIAFFTVPAMPPNVDVLKLCDLSLPFPGVANHYRPTILVDLRLAEEDLWNAVTAPTRKLIRQAVRQNITVEPVAPLTEATWNAFLAAYGKLSHRKTHVGALGVGQIGELVASSRFDLSVSRNADGEILSWHAYVRTQGRARLHTTISDMDPARGHDWNTTVGRANRLHHWQDMLRFKAAGMHTYDFGGVYRGSDDQEQINIARFKQLFGGAFADTYDAVLPLTMKGRMALSLASHAGDTLRAGGRTEGAPA